MLSVYGWCVLQTSRDCCRTATLETLDGIDEQVDRADAALWKNFRDWIEVHGDRWMTWQLLEQANNDRGVLLFHLSRNHREETTVWEMLRWIVENGPASYGLVYVHDDEDGSGARGEGRGGHDFSNVFRVHRLMNGQIMEMADPFLSPIVPNLNP